MKFKNKILAYSLSIAIAGMGLSSCGASKGVKGGAIGAAIGGVAGGLIGNNNGSTTKGAILGAVIGGAAGGSIGAYMDKQANEIEADLKGADVERVGEGIKITFDSGILFAVGKSDLTPATKTSLLELSETLKKYEDTKILVEGHTDASGGDELNMKLSKERASAVASYVIGLGVSSARITTQGYGETQPVASNETKEGKMKNRRVEMAIFANDKLKKAAERGDKLDPK